MKQLTAIAAIWLVAVLPALADTVLTQNGQRYEGALTLQADGIQIGTTFVPLKDLRKATRDLDSSDGFKSEPLAAGFAGGVAVVHRGFSREVESDIALLLTISRCCFDWVGLFAVSEGHLNSECAVW